MRTIKSKITMLTICFTVILSLLVTGFSFSLFNSYSRQTRIQGAEFNLHLVGGLASQDMVAINSLLKWFSTSAQVSTFLQEDSLSSSLETYERIKEEMMNNHAQQYVQRIIVTKGNGQFIHIGVSANSKPVTPYNLNLAINEENKDPQKWNAIQEDPFLLSEGTQILPIVRALANGGFAYLAVKGDIILTQLTNYQLPKGSYLYLTLGDQAYRIEDTHFIPVGNIENWKEKSSRVTESNDRIQKITDSRGNKLLVISCATGFPGVWLSQSIAEGFFIEKSIYLTMLGLLVVAVILFGCFMAVYLNRTITVPVSKIQQKTKEIAKGNFKADPNIEWNNELGDIGRSMNELSTQIVTLLDKRVADEKQKQELEYRMLQSQINPHFLFNTLNSIKWMATIQNSPGIAEMTTALSRLMKNIAKSKETVVPLKDELSLIEDYIVIQQYRYGGTLKVIIDIPLELQNIPILRFTLQPLVENAIFHGIEPNGGAGTIEIKARALDDCIEITISDDGIGMTEQQLLQAMPDKADKNSGLFKGIGIGNVDKRLKYIFGKQYGIKISSTEGKGTVMFVYVPRSQEKDNEIQSDSCR
ncbi:MAG: sensor histidine kinase [Sphaerochaetaceae bacterium]